MKTIEVSESALESLKAMAQKLQEERDMLLVALEDAACAIEDWGCYASAYFQEKHNLSGDIAKARAAIAACQESTKVLES